MRKEELVKEVNRQLVLKSEVTSIGPPYVVLKGEDVLKALADSKPISGEDLQEIRRVHFLVQRLWHGPKEMRAIPAEQALIDKWQPIDITGMLLDEVSRLQRRVDELEGDVAHAEMVRREEGKRS